jgi:hypothetical protein
MLAVTRKFLSSPGSFLSRKFIDLLCSIYPSDQAKMLFTEAATRLSIRGIHLNLGIEYEQVAPYLYYNDGSPNHRSLNYDSIQYNLGRLGWYTLDSANHITRLDKLPNLPTHPKPSVMYGYAWKSSLGDDSRPSGRKYIISPNPDSDVTLADRDAVFGKVFDLIRCTSYDTSTIKSVDELIADLGRMGSTLESPSSRCGSDDRGVHDRVNSLWGSRVIG